MENPDTRVYSPGLEGVLAGETSIALIDGKNGRLLYRGYPIGELVREGTYAQVVELLWTGEWPTSAHLPCSPLDERVLASLRNLPSSANAMDALRTAVSTWGAAESPGWPPTVEQARTLTAMAPSALAAFARLRDGLDPVEPDPELELAAGFLHQLTGKPPDAAAARALDAYFVVAAEHSFNASTFTARVITSTGSDLASAVCGALCRRVRSRSRWRGLTAFISQISKNDAAIVHGRRLDPTCSKPTGQPQVNPSDRLDHQLPVNRRIGSERPMRRGFGAMGSVQRPRKNARSASSASLSA